MLSRGSLKALPRMGHPPYFVKRSFGSLVSHFCRLQFASVSRPSDAMYKCLSTLTEATSSDRNDCFDNTGGGHTLSRQRKELIRLEEKVRYIPVKAYFLCTSIDLKNMLTENAHNVVVPTSRSTNYITFRYCRDSPCSLGRRIKDHDTFHQYMVVFQYGSAVLFNILDHEAEDYLDIVRKHASGLLPETKRDDYAVVEKPVLATWMQGGLDHIILRSLDTDGIRIIGSVLGQSIALDYFIHQVDHMVEEFVEINRTMEKTGTFAMERKKLFQLVGTANSNLADVIIKLGLLDRSEIAWRNSNYDQILEYLHEEFEISQRFGSLDFKLKFVEQNIQFLLEVLANKRSSQLEWFVVILLAVDNLLYAFEVIKKLA